MVRKAHHRLLAKMLSRAVAWANISQILAVIIKARWRSTPCEADRAILMVIAVDHQCIFRIVINVNFIQTSHRGGEIALVKAGGKISERGPISCQGFLIALPDLTFVERVPFKHLSCLDFTYFITSARFELHLPNFDNPCTSRVLQDPKQRLCLMDCLQNLGRSRHENRAIAPGLQTQWACLPPSATSPAPG